MRGDWQDGSVGKELPVLLPKVTHDMPRTAAGGAEGHEKHLLVAWHHLCLNEGGTKRPSSLSE